ncbi:hypothetical protein Caci_7176 [Catenulispora acidiphila DSM 44928]|uniref:Uncharacterized protein n=1 Tax=Catenulispora acidiphila (strain DSM 44928 / JCM 14897 / NBRC 102108 / NRRL B-24433 / ID139908) TaxID=479433 RepID=C7Q6Z2_CATAD|nr:hypothetical protein Caci_7176 [Catenulispora acidiphila DSM 44928]
MSVGWETTTLLRVADQAHVRSEPSGDGRETQGLIECPSCHRVTDWLIAAMGMRVDVACRCGNRWEIPTTLQHVVAMAESQPIDPQWTCLDDARRALGFTRHADTTRGRRRRRHRRSSD